jgi:DNA-binding PadR family transcriptional regulator
LERAGLVRVQGTSSEDVTARKVYEATAAGHDVAHEWLMDTTWQRVAPLDFHLKLVAAAVTGTADPLSLIDAQRRELLRVLSEVQKAQSGQQVGSEGALLAEGTSLRLQADLRWLDACERWATGLNPEVIS